VITRRAPEIPYYRTDHLKQTTTPSARERLLYKPRTTVEKAHYSISRLFERTEHFTTDKSPQPNKSIDITRRTLTINTLRKPSTTTTTCSSESKLSLLLLLPTSTDFAVDEFNSTDVFHIIKYTRETFRIRRDESSDDLLCLYNIMM
jgi:hypothetical protein